MKAISLRLSTRCHDMILDGARTEGVSTSQFIREAALMRAVLIKAREGDYDLAAQFELEKTVRSFLEGEDRRRGTRRP